MGGESDYRFVYKHYRFLDIRYHGFQQQLRASVRRIEGDDKPDGPVYNGMHGLAWHYRKGNNMVPSAEGGYTFCFVYHGDEVIAIGRADCSPRDQFCYRIGRTIAKGRALDYLRKKRMREIREAAEDACMVSENDVEWIKTEVEE